MNSNQKRKKQEGTRNVKATLTTTKVTLNLSHSRFRRVLAERSQKHTNIVDRDLLVTFLIEQCKRGLLFTRHDL
jgi:hypothetical protein